MVRWCSNASSNISLSCNVEVQRTVGSLGRPAQRGVLCENWHVDAFMPLSRCLQCALEGCHNAFFSLSGARPCPQSDGIPLLPSVPSIIVACDSYSSHPDSTFPLNSSHSLLCYADATKTTFFTLLNVCNPIIMRWRWWICPKYLWF